MTSTHSAFSVIISESFQWICLANKQVSFFYTWQNMDKYSVNQTWSYKKKKLIVIM